jgi:hypothetical protein
MTKKSNTKRRARKSSKAATGVPKTSVTNKDIKAMVSSMARAAIKTQTNNYQNSSSVLGNLGMMAGNGISKMFGLGAYKLRSNSLFDSATGSQVPFMHSTDESIVFRHREYLGEISSSTDFSAQIFNVNPGLSSAFPYLASIASSFQEYRFRGLVYEYKSSSATALVSGTNTAMGVVMLAAQYRADAPVFVNKVEMLNEMWSVDCKPSENVLLPIECNPKENPMNIQYVRTGAATGDVKLYDLCNVVVATQGSQSSNIIGELWVSYEIELFKPAVTPSGGIIAASHFRLSSSATDVFGVAGGVPIYNPLSLVNSARTITFPGGTTGTFVVVVNWAGVAAVVSYPTVTYPSNAFARKLFYTGSASLSLSPDNGVNSTNYTLMYAFTIQPVTTTTVITWGAGVYPTAASGDLYVYEVPDDIS